MTSDVHDRLVTSTTFCEFGYERVPSIVKTPDDPCLHLHVAPCSLERRNRLGWIERALLARRGFANSAGKHVPLWLCSAELGGVPPRMYDQRGHQGSVQRDCPTFACLGF